MTDLNRLAQVSYEVCKQAEWSRNWVEAGCYLHLEVSEFVEALRGKNGNPTEEAVDILFVLLSTLEHYNISPDYVANILMSRLHQALDEAKKELPPL